MSISFLELYYLIMQCWLMQCIWVKSWNCGCLVTWFCYQLIAKPGNKTAAVLWLDPYCIYKCFVFLVVGGYIGFTPSVRLSVRLSRLPCPLCNIYSSGWILSILATNYHYHVRVCRTQWPLTLTYIFKVIWPWLRKPCPLCSIYSSQWILFIFGTNDHYY